MTQRRGGILSEKNRGNLSENYSSMEMLGLESQC